MHHKHHSYPQLLPGHNSNAGSLPLAQPVEEAAGQGKQCIPSRHQQGPSGGKSCHFSNTTTLVLPQKSKNDNPHPAFRVIEPPLRILFQLWF